MVWDPRQPDPQKSGPALDRLRFWSRRRSSALGAKELRRGEGREVFFSILRKTFRVIPSTYEERNLLTVLNLFKSAVEKGEQDNLSLSLAVQTVLDECAVSDSYRS